MFVCQFQKDSTTFSFKLNRSPISLPVRVENVVLTQRIVIGNDGLHYFISKWSFFHSNLNEKTEFKKYIEIKPHAIWFLCHFLHETSWVVFVPAPRAIQWIERSANEAKHKDIAAIGVNKKVTIFYGNYTKAWKFWYCCGTIIRICRACARSFWRCFFCGRCKIARKAEIYSNENYSLFLKTNGTSDSLDLRLCT